MTAPLVAASIAVYNWLDSATLTGEPAVLRDWAPTLKPEDISGTTVYVIPAGDSDFTTTTRAGDQTVELNIDIVIVGKLSQAARVTDHDALVNLRDLILRGAEGVIGHDFDGFTCIDCEPLEPIDLAEYREGVGVCRVRLTLKGTDDHG